MAPSANTPKRVGELLTAALPGLAPRLLEEEVRREWTEVVGRNAARRSRPLELRRGILSVVVDNSPWLQELTLRRAEIVAALEARHPGAISELRFTVGPVGPAGTPRRPDAPRAAPAPTEEERRTIETAAAAVRDPELGAALRRLLGKALPARRQRGDRP